MAKQTELDESVAVTDLFEALPVTRSSTTSRVLVNNPALRVVVFAFDEGEMLTEHSSPRAVVVHLLDGAMRFTTGGVEHAMVPGDVLYLPPNQSHSLVADAPSRMSLVMVDVGETAAG